MIKNIETIREELAELLYQIDCENAPCETQIYLNTETGELQTYHTSGGDYYYRSNLDLIYTVPRCYDDAVDYMAADGYPALCDWILNIPYEDLIKAAQTYNKLDDPGDVDSYALGEYIRHTPELYDKVYAAYCDWLRDYMTNYERTADEIIDEYERDHC